MPIRVKNCTKLSVWLDDSLLAELRTAASITGITMSNIIRMATQKELINLQPIIERNEKKRLQEEYVRSVNEVIKKERTGLYAEK